MNRYELHHGDSVIKSESIQELYQLSLHTESDWKIYSIFPSSMNDDVFIGHRLLPRKLVEGIKKEMDKSSAIATIARKNRIYWQTANRIVKKINAMSNR